jgi:hypothetical protein
LTAQAAGTVTSADIANAGAKGILLYINITAITGTLTVTVQGKSAVSGVYYTILVSTALAGTGLTVLRVYPSLTAAANLVANDLLPSTWRVSSTVATGPCTAAITATTSGV